MFFDKQTITKDYIRYRVCVCRNPSSAVYGWIKDFHPVHPGRPHLGRRAEGHAARLLITRRATSTGYRAERGIITKVGDRSSVARRPGQIIIRKLDDDET